MTVVDERSREPDHPRNALVGYGAHADEVLDLILDAAIDPS
jgi:hypothetical protein